MNILHSFFTILPKNILPYYSLKMGTGVISENSKGRYANRQLFKVSFLVLFAETIL